MMFWIHTNCYFCMYNIAARASYQTTYPVATTNKTVDESWHGSSWHHNTNLSVAPPQCYFNRFCFVGQTPTFNRLLCYPVVVSLWIGLIKSDVCFSIFAGLSPMLRKISTHICEGCCSCLLVSYLKM
jgi:hypothetical protein